MVTVKPKDGAWWQCDTTHTVLTKGTRD